MNLWLVVKEFGIKGQGDVSREKAISWLMKYVISSCAKSFDRQRPRLSMMHIALQLHLVLPRSLSRDRQLKQ
jgi:hypothetical protein